MWSIALLDFFLTTTMVNFRLNYFVHSASAYKIWRLSLQSFRRFDYEHRKWKRVMWPWLCLFRGWFVILRLAFNTFYLCAKFDDSSLNHSKDNYHWIPQFLKWITWPWPRPCYGSFVISMHAGTWHSLLCANLTIIASAVPEYGWCPRKCKWFTWPDYAPFRDDL